MTKPYALAIFRVLVFAACTPVVPAADSPATALRAAARAFAPAWQAEAIVQDIGGTRQEVLLLYDQQEILTGYAFRTLPLAPAIEGHNGPIDMAAVVTSEGELVGVKILASRETPAFLRAVEAWLPTLHGRRIFGPADIRSVDSVSGATVTAEAVLDSLYLAGQAFATELRGELEAAHLPARPWSPRALLLLLAFAAAAGMRLLPPSRRLRRLWLAAILLVFGLLWNLQYSFGTLLRLIRLEGPPIAVTPVFVLTAGVPLLVLLAGNLYCGWLCPFGALQELVGEWRRGWFVLDPDRREWSRWRRFKILLPAAALILGLLLGSPWIMQADPLAHAFGPHRGSRMFLFAVGLTVAALFFGRFWCRNLCPTGTALALLGRLSPLRKRWPRILPSRCDYGVATVKDVDCLLCDRCRCPGAEQTGRATLSARKRRALFLLLWMLSLIAWGWALSQG